MQSRISLKWLLLPAAILSVFILLDGSKPASHRSELQRQGSDRGGENKSIGPVVMPALTESEYQSQSPGDNSDQTSVRQALAFDDWPVLLFPELEQIENLENSAAADALYPLHFLSTNPDPAVRLAALESLATMRYSELQSTMLVALTDENHLIRLHALETLGLQSDSAVIANIEPFLYDPDHELRVAAIEALSNFEASETAAIALSVILNNEDASIRRFAVNALGEIGGDSAIYYLIQATSDRDAIVRVNAASILFELGQDPEH